MKISLRTLKIFYCILLIGLFGLGLLLAYTPQSQKTASRLSPRVAIVIDDFGGYAAGINQMMALPFSLTFAVMPDEEFASRQGREATGKGFEVIVHMPFEAISANPKWYGKRYISTAMSNKEIRTIIHEAFTILPTATGMNNHMGSKATADGRLMQVVLEEVTRSHRYFFNSKTAYHSPIPELTATLGLPYVERDLFLDEQGSVEQIHRQLHQLVSLAQQKGFAIGIGHVGPTGPTLAQILKEEIPGYQRQGIHFVHLSELIHNHL
jgi:polysaccharide deacetylase 2 family uncharacterized protein YibQ